MEHQEVGAGVPLEVPAAKNNDEGAEGLVHRQLARRVPRPLGAVGQVVLPPPADKDRVAGHRVER
eukprot:CAMPEP_0171250684 /NCGR_PEP_ID=MMETSP0790-20130122/50233_1 /TAXON_ID=2925 /ORGANISM="Alexandrium catenella, Strain OF101" /LENGTH=64 /DNA_ID=CAMNT_0011718323 /DNA_START=45 /DNA_END=235 /DNA_ORIENTATION=-